MATLTPNTGSVGPDTLITVKVAIDGTNRRFKLALRDLGAHILPQKLRFLLAVPPQCEVRFERFSDSAGTYIALDSTNPTVYKQLYRAAKAKLKLRLKATVTPAPRTNAPVEARPHVQSPSAEESKSAPTASRPNTYLETVLSHLPTSAEPVSSFKAVHNIPCTYPDTYDMPKPSTRSTAAADLSRPTLPTLNDFGCGIFSIDCNYCGKSVPSEHYHCSICENGDFDLCQTCVNAGISCQADDHWLIKRTIKNGRVLPSVTETLPPKGARKQAAATSAIKVIVQDEEERTCNSCISQLPASSFVTCKDCPDFDLCFLCFSSGDHGHHPAHTFQAVNPKASMASVLIQKLLGPGRGLAHEAICDGCDKQIVGIRHKCLTCPDFDYCSKCVKSASTEHSGHRFAPLYEELSTATSHFRSEVHRGVYCDGPLCVSRAQTHWITGDRYKCSICHDTDFCASCEAHPTLGHNKTHPLIKIKTPIRGIVVEAVEEGAASTNPVQLGDRPLARNASTETNKPASINAATQVQTIAEVKPVEIEVLQPVKPSTPENKTPQELQAWFEADSTADGTTFEPNHHVSQSWTLSNPGPRTWPAGCAVHFIGGDDMRNLDTKRPSSVNSLAAANQSNVLEEPLEPGKTAVFTVLLKSPAREGRAISYWRMKTPEGLPFGHKLWVDITVARKSSSPSTPPPAAAAPVPEPFKVESSPLAGSSMIFPKLEKESANSSVHSILDAPSVVAATTTTEATAVAEDDLIDDLESLELEEEASDDEFLTDEEYDILDADDEDFLEEAQRAVASKK